MGIDGFSTAFAATAASPVLDFADISLLLLETGSAGSVEPFGFPMSFVDMIVIVAKN